MATPAFHSMTVSRTRLMMSRPTPGKPEASVDSTAPETRSTSAVRRMTIDERSRPSCRSTRLRSVRSNTRVLRTREDSFAMACVPRWVT